MKYVWIVFMIFGIKIESMFIGTATSSYQIEGWNKGKSIWDEYTKIKNLHPVGNATNHYILYKEDIRMMFEMGIRHYRFSISWTRIMPYQWGEIDPSAIQFYHSLLDEILYYNITPYATIYHWDMPNYLDVSQNGWLNSTIIDYFLNYSRILFEEYGNKINNWMTINEPLTTSNQGYGKDCNFAPGKNCSEINKYISARNQLLAHAIVGNYYKNNYKGNISLVINANWIEPKDTSPNSIKYRDEYMDSTLGLFLHPLIYGQYPKSLQEYTIRFTEEESNLLMNSYTILSINHYTTYLVNKYGNTNVDPYWYQASSKWLFDVPMGISRLIQYIREYYTESLPIMITECGFSVPKDGEKDLQRIHYFSGYLNEMYDFEKNHHKKGIDGIFLWSFLDNFEWSSGYNESFGIIKVNFSTFERIPKLSSSFITSLIKLENNKI